MSHSLFNLLRYLDGIHYNYVLSRVRKDAILVTITFVGERVEVEVFEDGHMEVSRFLGTEDILGGEELVYDILKRQSSED